MKPTKRIFVVVRVYLPGFKYGGPTRAIADLVEFLGRECQFYIATADRDWKDTHPYPGVKRDCWQRVGKAQVIYLSSFSTLTWYRLLNEQPYDLIYLNSFLSPITLRILVMRALRLIPPAEVVLSPRGELAPGALALKSRKKRSYIALMRATGLFRRLTWQATSEAELHDIEALFGGDLRNGRSAAVIAPNLRKLPPQSGLNHPSKIPGSARIIFFSRISRKKNLIGALRLLAACQGDIQFDIRGPLEDTGYWRECEALIQTMPANIRVTYGGAVEPQQVLELLAGYHCLLFPTFGENFGHVILEALCAGCPVMISDLTPWRDLEAKQGGWDIALDEPQGFQRALTALLAMDNAAFLKLSHGARKLGEGFVANPDLIQMNRRLLQLD